MDMRRIPDLTIRPEIMRRPKSVSWSKNAHRPGMCKIEHDPAVRYCAGAFVELILTIFEGINSYLQAYKKEVGNL